MKACRWNCTFSIFWGRLTFSLVSIFCLFICSWTLHQCMSSLPRSKKSFLFLFACFQATGKVRQSSRCISLMEEPLNLDRPCWKLLPWVSVLSCYLPVLFSFNIMHLPLTAFSVFIIITYLMCNTGTHFGFVRSSMHLWDKSLHLFNIAAWLVGAYGYLHHANWIQFWHPEVDRWGFKNFNPAINSSWGEKKNVIFYCHVNVDNVQRCKLVNFYGV